MRWRRRRSRVQPTGTYTQWQWPSAADGYRSFAWDLTPQTDPSPDGYFWSHQFWLVGGEGGYLGLQTCGAALLVLRHALLLRAVLRARGRARRRDPGRPPQLPERPTRVSGLVGDRRSRRGGAGDGGGGPAPGRLTGGVEDPHKPVQLPQNRLCVRHTS